MPAIKLDQLPPEVLSTIIQKLPIEDVHNLILTCKALRDLIINDNAIWRLINRTRLIIQDCEKNRIPERSCYDQCRISHNWCKGVYKNRNILYHDKNYMPWLKYNSEALLLTVGSDLHCYPVDKNGFPVGRRYMWKLSMPKINRNDKRTDDISRFVLKENLLVCGNRNGSVAVYKVDNLSSQPQLVQYIDNCHIDGGVEVSAVEIINNKDHAYLVTGSMDSPLVLFWYWNMDSDSPDLSRSKGEAEICFGMELGGDDDCRENARCLAFNQFGNQLAIGPNRNSKPVTVDVNRMEYLIKSDETSNEFQIVKDIQWHDNNTLCYVTHAGRLELMDVRTHGVVYKTKDPFQSSFYCVKTDGNHAIVAGTSLHSRCVLYDTRKPFHTQLYFTQDKWKSSPVYSLDFDSKKLIAAAARGVSALDFDAPPDSSPVRRDYSALYSIVSSATRSPL